MLALIKDNAVLNRREILGQYSEGGWVDLPDGSRVSPAQEGWTLRGYELHTVEPAEAVPTGHRVISSSVQIVDGLPKWVNSVEPISVKIEDYKAAFDDRLDIVAQSKGYDNRLTIASYSGSTNPVWAGEAAAFIEWRDAALSSMFYQLAAVEAGGQAPTLEEFVAALPEIVWP
ncbi:hypothetical protein [Agrobacterium rosae]|uniref:DUF4376 domain-containing protein n=1 Tax=Agrobacterium rosae TaxID=1972867 RepID=A0AAW9FJU6_9HYPH|nr:hypothetical protein [Agrobacterium rosae]MDX8302799.1 hypothetical protein [Agrobacterium rosae]